MDKEIKTVKYKKSDIQQVVQLLDGLVVQGLNNMRIITAVGQILINNQLNNEE